MPIEKIIEAMKLKHTQASQKSEHFEFAMLRQTKAEQEAAAAAELDKTRLHDEKNKMDKTNTALYDDHEFSAISPQQKRKQEKAEFGAKHYGDRHDDSSDSENSSEDELTLNQRVAREIKMDVRSYAQIGMDLMKTGEKVQDTAGCTLN